MDLISCYRDNIIKFNDKNYDKIDQYWKNLIFCMVNELTCPNGSTIIPAKQGYEVDIDFCPSCKDI